MKNDNDVHIIVYIYTYFIYIMYIWENDSDLTVLPHWYHGSD